MELEEPLLPASGSDDDDDNENDTLASEPAANSSQTMEQEPATLPLLSRPLWWLYYLHGGFTLALPSTAIMYMINTHVEMPVSMLPTYGTLAFLPFSFKPLYAYLTVTTTAKDGNGVGVFWRRRDVQLCGLLMINALLFASTAVVPRHGVLLFLAVSFLRGVTTSWPELLLGLSLVDQAWESCDEQQQQQQQQPQQQSETDYESVAARFQAQAATARNLGSVAAHLVALLLFVWDYISKRSSTEPFALTKATSTMLLFMTSLTSLVCAGVVFWFQVGKPRLPPPVDFDESDLWQEMNLSAEVDSGGTTTELDNDTIASETTQDCSSIALYQGVNAAPDADANEPSKSLCRSKEVIVVILFQIVVVLMALREPLAQQYNALVGGCRLCTVAVMGGGCVVVVLSLVVFMFWSDGNNTTASSSSTSASASSIGGGRAYRVGLFLILRHVIPNAAFLLDSFRYSVFASTFPLLLQLLSVLDMVVLTGASWSFGLLFSQFSSGSARNWFIAGTTTLAAVASLSNLWFVHTASLANVVLTATLSSSSIAKLFGIAAATSLLSSWAGEWNFLPDVVLATTSVKPRGDGDWASDSAVSAASMARRASDEEMLPLHEQSRSREEDGGMVGKQTRGIQYGAFVTCIDFGDQLGALTTGALVSLFGITREAGWEGLDEFVCLCALLTLLSISFLVLL